MIRRFLFGAASALFVVSNVARSQSEEPITSTMKSASLAAALKAKDEATVQRLVAEAFAKLGDQAGVPEAPDEFRPAPAETLLLSRADAFVGFEKLLKLTRQTKWWKVGLDPSKTKHLPGEYSAKGEREIQTPKLLAG